MIRGGTEQKRQRPGIFSEPGQLEELSGNSVQPCGKIAANRGALGPYIKSYPGWLDPELYDPYLVGFRICGFGWIQSWRIHFGFGSGRIQTFWIRSSSNNEQNSVSRCGFCSAENTLKYVSTAGVQLS